jgi:hypothetical protein
MEDIVTFYNETDQNIFGKSQQIDMVDTSPIFNSKKRAFNAQLTVNDEDNVAEGRSSVNNTPKPESIPIIIQETTSAERKPLIKNYPNLNYQRLLHYMVAWKRLELLKLNWARRMFDTEEIKTTKLFVKYWYVLISSRIDAYLFQNNFFIIIVFDSISNQSELYKKEIILPLLYNMLIDKDSADAKDFVNNFDEKRPVILPKGITDLESKMAQVCLTFSTLIFKPQINSTF